MGKREMHTVVKKPQGKTPFEGQGADGRIILKQTFER
jgi:hypothetical protein